ncbi:MAG: Na+/H+ antiporter subunit G [Rhodobacteraceae bacterium]|jgi:multicomponent K+:H+ antiporter subunit G|nr:Na+/H+ antiporter subunit G [Paracoccaceae bacterium]
MAMLAEAAVAGLLVVAGVFGLVGSYGLLKLPDLMTRLHAPTKATTLGVGGVLIASMIHFAVFEGHLSFHELLITLFLFLTAPITAHFIAKAWLHRNARAADLPPPGGAKGWATFEAAPDDHRRSDPAAPPKHEA